MTGTTRESGSKTSLRGKATNIAAPKSGEQGLCRDCIARLSRRGGRCPHCKSPRLLFHPELHDLTIAHIDCDAFFAAIEKRDHPEWRTRPVIVGGGARGVVSTACYIARQSGVHSAMPMFRAKRACPEAVVVSSNFGRYREAAQELRRRLRALTPIVQPASIDEAYLDLRGTKRLHKKSAAQLLAQLAQEVERAMRLTISIGLSHNKFLAKLASDTDKPRGFAVVGERDALPFLAALPIEEVRGIGRATAKYMHKRGITTLGQIQKMRAEDAERTFGEQAAHWLARAHGIDEREVRAQPEPTKSISTETTFPEDLSDPQEMERRLWHLAEKLGRRCVEAELAGATLTIKMKTSQFRLLTRAQTLDGATRLPKVLFATGARLMRKVVAAEPRTKWRLLGIGVSTLVPLGEADLPDLLAGGQSAEKQVHLQDAIDRLRNRFGKDSVQVGRGLARSGEKGLVRPKKTASRTTKRGTRT